MPRFPAERGSRGSFGSLALSSDPAALPGDSAESSSLRVGRLVGQAGLCVDPTQRRLDRARRAGRSQLRRDLLVRRQTFEARPRQPRPAKTLHDLTLEGRQLRGSRRCDFLERFGRFGILQLRRPREEDGLRADSDPVGVAEREWDSRLDACSVQECAVEAATILDVPASVADTSAPRARGSRSATRTRGRSTRPVRS